MRLGCAGGDLIEDLEGPGVYGGDGLVELGGDVEDVAMGVVDGKVGADAVAEVDNAGDFAGGDVDDEHLLAVGAGAAYAGVAVDGQVGGAAVGRGGDFVAGDAVFLEGEGLLCGRGVDEGEGVVLLIGYEEGALILGDGGGAGCEQAGGGGGENADLHGREFTWRRRGWDSGGVR